MPVEAGVESGTDHRPGPARRFDAMSSEQRIGQLDVQTHRGPERRHRRPLSERRHGGGEARPQFAYLVLCSPRSAWKLTTMHREELEQHAITHVLEAVE